MSLLGCLVITEGYIVAYLATNLQKESYTIQSSFDHIVIETIASPFHFIISCYTRPL